MAYRAWLTCGWQKPAASYESACAAFDAGGTTTNFAKRPIPSSCIPLFLHLFYFIAASAEAETRAKPIGVNPNQFLGWVGQCSIFLLRISIARAISASFFEPRLLLDPGLYRTLYSSENGSSQSESIFRLSGTGFNLQFPAQTPVFHCSVSRDRAT
jgi:hypothetical protein